MASGHTSFATGYSTTASGQLSSTFGELTSATGYGSMAMGYHTTAQSLTSLVIGAYNIIAGDPNVWYGWDPLFVVGNGEAASARSNAFTVYKNGTADLQGHINLKKGSTGGALYVNNSEAIWYDGTYFSWGYGGQSNYFADKVGIGTDSPTYNLHVVSNLTTNDDPAIYGIHSVTDNYGVGVYGASRWRGVEGNASSGSGNIAGVYGYASGTGTGDRYGIYGWATGGANAYAGYFDGNVHVNGTLSKSAGSFLIDHPLDPENKTLSHSFVESPDMKNIYDGTIVLDANGVAVVQLPDWFEALNRDFRYQLTAIGSPGPNLYVSREVRNNQFEISGGSSGQKVSWQLTGIRKDPYAEKYRIVVEEIKPEDSRGLYLNPGAYNLPESKGMIQGSLNKK